MSYPSMNKDHQQIKYNVTKVPDRRKNRTVKYIVIHYTATDASAKNNCVYFGSGNRNVSADYFLDKDGEIYKFNKDCSSYYTWHCGDGYGKYGITNRNSIGIEVVGSGKEFTPDQKISLKKLVQAIQADYGISDSNIKRHYDASKKLCPLAYCGSDSKNKKWKELHAYLTSNEIKDPVSTSKSFKVKVTTGGLNVRKGPGTEYSVIKCITDKGTYTITETKKSWGKLKSGSGWINLNYTKKL